MLLAKLHADALTSQNTLGGLKKTLNNLPRDLESAFSDTMLRIRQQRAADAELAHSILMWVVGAGRPLTLSELRCAVALRLQAPSVSQLVNLTDYVVSGGFTRLMQFLIPLLYGHFIL